MESKRSLDTTREAVGGVETSREVTGSLGTTNGRRGSLETAVTRCLEHGRRSRMSGCCLGCPCWLGKGGDRQLHMEVSDNSSGLGCSHSSAYTSPSHSVVKESSTMQLLWTFFPLFGPWFNVSFV